MYNIPYAGHHGTLSVLCLFQPSDLDSSVYLDNPTAVNELLVAELNDAGEQLYLFAASRS
jgi:cardiolipin-specific phospholipase